MGVFSQAQNELVFHKLFSGFCRRFRASVSQRRRTRPVVRGDEEGRLHRQQTPGVSRQLEEEPGTVKP